MATASSSRISPNMLELDFAVDGMTCASCVRRVEQALSKVDGVSDVRVNLATERAQFAVDTTQVEAGQLRDAITNAGYAPGTIEYPAPAPGYIPGCRG